jgi:hypothetical protein
MAIAGLVCGVAAHAGDDGKQAASHADTCVDVSINDHPVLAYACLNRQLAPATSAPFTPDLTAGVAREPSNRQVGQFNYSAFSNRMGNQLGKSVHPQRLPPLAPPPLLAPGR